MGAILKGMPGSFSVYMEKGSNISQKNTSRKVFFIIGWLLLMLMALSWSIDNSIVLILGAGAAYFFFLGFYTIAPARGPGKWNETEGSYTHRTATDFGDIFKNLFSKVGTVRPASRKVFAGSNVDSKRRVVAPLIFLAIFGLFFIFLLGIVFSSPGDTTQFGDYYNRAESQFIQGDYDSAYVTYRRAWKFDRSNAEAMVGYGNVLAVRNLYDSAALMYDMAFAVNPEYLGAAYAKGAMLYNVERYSECIAFMDPLLRKNTDYYDGMLLIGDCYYSLRQYDDAIGWYENAYQNGGSRSSALCHIMAYIYDSKGSYDKAINLYKEALEYDSTIVSIYKRLGELMPGDEGNYYRTQAAKLGE